MKSSFVLYSDLIHTVEKLTPAQAGELFFEILNYVNGNETAVDDHLIEIAFEPIKQQLKRDKNKWEKIAETRKVVGKKGGDAKAKANKDRALLATASKGKQTLAKPSKGKQTLANLAVNGSVNVNVSVNDNVNGKDLKTNMSGKDALEVFNFWCSIMNKKSSCKFTGKRKRTVLQRLADGYTVEDIKQAITNCAKSPYHMGKNDAGTVYDDLGLICRSGEKLEWFRDSVAKLTPSSKNTETLNDFISEAVAQSERCMEDLDQWDNLGDEDEQRDEQRGRLQ